MTRATAMLLAIVCGHTYAATSDTICDRANRHNLSLEVPANSLAVDVVDHGTADKARSPRSQRDVLDGVSTFRDTNGFAAPDAARDAIILQRIFNEVGPDDRLVNDRIDELVNEDQIDDDLIDERIDNSSDSRIRFRRAVRENVTVDLGRRDTESSDDNVDPGLDEADNNVPDINARLPGVSLDETLRYRREMYRTDI